MEHLLLYLALHKPWTVQLRIFVSAKDFSTPSRFSPVTANLLQIWRYRIHCKFLQREQAIAFRYTTSWRAQMTHHIARVELAKISYNTVHYDSVVQSWKPSLMLLKSYLLIEWALTESFTVGNLASCQCSVGCVKLQSEVNTTHFLVRLCYWSDNLRQQWSLNIADWRLRVWILFRKKLCWVEWKL